MLCRTRYTDDEGGEVAEQSPRNIIALLRQYLGAPPYVPPTPADLAPPPTPAAAGSRTGEYATPSDATVESMPRQSKQSKGGDATPGPVARGEAEGAIHEGNDTKAVAAMARADAIDMGVTQQLPNSEADAVLRFLEEHTGREGLAAVGVALLEEMTRDPGKKLPSGVPEVLMKLEGYLQGAL
jgi:hypothetical protein